QTEEGWQAGQGEFGNFGMMFPQPVSVTRQGGKADAEETRFWFPVSEVMLEVARESASGASLEKCTPDRVCLEHDPKVVLGGNGVSGPTFVDNAEYRLWVWQTFQADALDMESAAVAHVAYTNAVPFIAFRSLSDLAGGGPGENEIGTFFELAAGNSAAVVMAFLEKWEP
ncbi:MAG: phosphorylase, partial [Chloroflexota bacterium]